MDSRKNLVIIGGGEFPAVVRKRKKKRKKRPITVSDLVCTDSSDVLKGYAAVALLEKLQKKVCSS